MTVTMRSALKRLIELEDQNGPDPVDEDSWTDAIADARTALLKNPGQTNPIDEDEIVDLESSLWVTARSLDHFGQCHVVPPALLFRAAELISKQNARIDELEYLIQENIEKNGTALAESGGEGPSLADVRQLCVDNELALFVDSSDFDTVVVAILEIVRTALARRGNLVTLPEPKRVEGVGELVEELELMAKRAADARQFGDAHFLFRAVALLQQLQTEQP
jgi:hypothetical protein